MDWSAESVLDYSPRKHCHYAKGSRRDLLWPAWSWRVSIPELTRARLNILEQTVLRLQIAGSRIHEDNAELLSLAPELVVYITQDLMRRGALDTDGTPTAKAASLLEATEPDLGQSRVAWVFQNAVTGDFFPRVVTEQPRLIVEVGNNGRPRILSGTKGNPYEIRPIMVPKTSAHPGRAPNPRQILAMARRHHHHRRNLQNPRRSCSAEPLIGTESPVNLSRVCVLSDTPTLVHLRTFVYRPESESEHEPWFVAEPFGFGACPKLREQLEIIRTGVGGTVRTLLDGITGGVKDQHRDAWAMMQRQMRDDARETVAQQFPLGVPIDDALLRSALEEAFMAMKCVESSAGDRDQSGRDLDPAYLRMRQAVEAGLALCRDAHSASEVWRKLFAGDEPLPVDHARYVLLKCAQGLGFSKEQVPWAVRKVKPGAVRYAAGDSGTNIRPLLAALILAAVDASDHPLRTIAASHPEWLNDISALADAAGDQVHGGKRQHRGIKELNDDMARCVGALKTLVAALQTARGV